MAPPDFQSAGVVIAAAGSGTRLGGEKKQFRLLGDKPLLVQSILPFQHHAAVLAVSIAVPPNDVEEVERMCRAFGLSKVAAVVPGGEHRQESVRSALGSLPPACTIVLTHDAVRPFVAATDIDAVLSALRTGGAAVLAAAVTDTLCRVCDGKVSERVDRDGVFRLLTPQAFRREILERGHARAAAESERYTDEVTMVKSLGVDVEIVPCASPNIKITTQADWEQANSMWPSWTLGNN